MKKLLSDYAKNHTSQFGEDGMIQRLVKQLNIRHGFCVEFGAGDGISCSNTKLLREQGWSALLIEADKALFDKMNHTGPGGAVIVNRKVSITGPDSIDELLEEYCGPHQVNFMSIDVDGDDFFIFQKMQCHPNIMCIEFNCSVPPHIALHGQEGGCFGASALAMKMLADAKDYRLMGISKTNMLLADKELCLKHGLTDYEDDLNILMQGRTFATVVSDYQGNGYLTPGTEHIYWGWKGLDGKELLCIPLE